MAFILNYHSLTAFEAWFVPPPPPNHPLRLAALASCLTDGFVSDSIPLFASCLTEGFVSDSIPLFASCLTDGFISDSIPLFASCLTDGFISDSIPLFASCLTDGWYHCPSPSHSLHLAALNRNAYLTDGFISDSIPLFGYRRRSYLVAAGLLGAASWTMLATWVDTPYGTVGAMLFASLSTAFSDVVVDSIVVERSRGAPQVGREVLACLGLPSIGQGA